MEERAKCRQAWHVRYDEGLDLSSVGRFSRYDDDLLAPCKLLLLSKGSAVVPCKPDISKLPVPVLWSVISPTLLPLGAPGVVVCLSTSKCLGCGGISRTHGSMSRQINEKMEGIGFCNVSYLDVRFVRNNWLCALSVAGAFKAEY